MAILVVTYDDSTGGFKVQKVGSAQISDGAIVSGKIGIGQVASGHLTAALIGSIEAVAVPAVTKINEWEYTVVAASTTLQLSAVGAGNNRLIVCFVTSEALDPVATAISIGGQAGEQISGSPITVGAGAIAQTISGWIIKEAAIAAKSNNIITITFTTPPNVVSISAAVFADVDQTTPIVEYQEEATGASTPNPMTAVDITVYSVKNYVVACAGAGGLYTATWHVDLTERVDVTMEATSAVSVADLGSPIIGNKSVECTWSAQNRAVIMSIEIGAAPQHIHNVDGYSGLLADDQHVIDAEAVAAAKTVKLDDFATPDDNVDLNASTSRHGLLRKLDNVATNFLNGQGNWAAPPGATESWLHTELVEDDIVVTAKATVSDFQANPATGDFIVGPECINDNNTTSVAIARYVNEYAEVDFGQPVLIKRWRQFGVTSNNGDGAWKIQYWSFLTDAWANWVTGIATRTTADWSSYVTETGKMTSKIRLVLTTPDGGVSYSRIMELEVIY